jgi:hypothetical protein
MLETLYLYPRHRNCKICIPIVCPRLPWMYYNYLKTLSSFYQSQDALHSRPHMTYDVYVNWHDHAHICLDPCVEEQLSSYWHVSDMIYYKFADFVKTVNNKGLLQTIWTKLVKQHHTLRLRRILVRYWSYPSNNFIIWAQNPTFHCYPF